VGVTALMKRLLPRKIFRGLLIDASRKKGYLPEKQGRTAATPAREQQVLTGPARGIDTVAA